MSNSIPMMISLYTNNSYLISPFADECNEFGFYDCNSDPKCKITNLTSTIQDPFLLLEGNITYVSVDLDNQHLHNSEMQFLYVDKCIRNHVEDTFNFVSGSIGLGTGGANRKIFTQDPSFSIYMNSDGQEGELIFGLDTSKIADYSSMTLFYSTNNWEIPIEASINAHAGSEKTNHTSNFTGTIIFNINACYIGFPSSLFNTVLQWLSLYKFKCQPQANLSTIPYTCDYKGDPLNLPSITITDNLDASSIRIGPEIYLRKIAENTYDFLIVQLESKNMSGDYSKTQKYEENVIMLGVPFMKWHYLYFGNEGTNAIIIYHSKNVDLSHPDKDKEKTGENKDNSYIGYLLFGICITVVIFVLILVGLLCKQSRNDRKPIMVMRGVQTGLDETEQGLRDQLYLGSLQRQTSGRVINPSRFSRK